MPSQPSHPNPAIETPTATCPRPRWALGIDLGGTKIAASVVSSDGDLSGEVRVPTPAADGPEAVIDAMVSTARRALAVSSLGPDDLTGVGVGAPGPVDPVRGRVVRPPNLPGWQDVALREALSTRLGLPVTLDNDANAAGLAEARFGAGRGCSPLLYLTVSTGIGGAILLDGQLLHGATGAAGEVGHIVLDPGGPRCGCGGRGCLEALASGTAIARDARAAIESGRDSTLAERFSDRPEDLGAADVARAARQGDALAAEVLTGALDSLGLGVASLVNVLNPARVVVGGGLSALGERLLAAILQGIARQANPMARSAVSVRLAALGPQVGVLGAAALVLFP